MSGTYNMNKFLEGEMTRDYYESRRRSTSCPDLEGKHLELLKERFILLAHGEGDYEEPSAELEASSACSARRASRTASTPGARSGATTG